MAASWSLVASCASGFADSLVASVLVFALGAAWTTGAGSSPGDGPSECSGIEVFVTAESPLATKLCDVVDEKVPNSDVNS